MDYWNQPTKIPSLKCTHQPLPVSKQPCTLPRLEPHHLAITCHMSIFISCKLSKKFGDFVETPPPFFFACVFFFLVNCSTQSSHDCKFVYMSEKGTISRYKKMKHLSHSFISHRSRFIHVYLNS